MKYQIKYVFILLFISLSHFLNAQSIKDSTSTKKISKLFSSKDILPIKLNYSLRDIKKESNDSTYVKSEISYLDKDGTWKSLEVQLRVRGNFRLDNCYFPPLKMKIKKSNSKETLFQGNKKIKVVFPCNMQKSGDDYILKEYMAYQMYEIISPYHFKTRLLDITYTEGDRNKTKTHQLKGIFIEDDEEVAKRHGGKVLDRSMHPLKQGDVTSVQNSFFQYMIGNTDFSTAIQHNEKLLYINKEIIPIPYDFDMAGLVNTSYSVVSVINGKSLPINSVRQRLYRGFKRNPEILQQVREEFLSNQTKLMEVVENLEPQFENSKDYEKAKNYISEFFEVMNDDKKYEKEITRKLRTK